VPNYTGGDARLPEDDLKKSNPENLAIQRPLLRLQNLAIASTHPHNSLSSFCAFKSLSRDILMPT
jgi:hypothetical protein